MAVLKEANMANQLLYDFFYSFRIAIVYLCVQAILGGWMSGQNLCKFGSCVMYEANLSKFCHTFM